MKKPFVHPVFKIGDKLTIFARIGRTGEFGFYHVDVQYVTRTVLRVVVSTDARVRSEIPVDDTVNYTITARKTDAEAEKIGLVLSREWIENERAILSKRMEMSHESVKSFIQAQMNRLGEPKASNKTFSVIPLFNDFPL